MRIIVLGTNSQFKRMLVLAMARIVSAGHSVKVYADHHYSYEDNPADTYDFCGIEIHRFADTATLPELIGKEDCEYLFFDVCRDVDAGTDVKIIAICEPERRSYEQTLENAGMLLQRYPYTDVHLVFANILEYCKINRAFMEKLYERAMKDSTNITRIYEVYFDERNAAALEESMYEERLQLRKLTTELKMQLVSILGDIVGNGIKPMKKILRKAERIKQACR